MSTLPTLTPALLSQGSYSSTETVFYPSAASFSNPVRVLQFGTGVLLRGLIDYFIDKANKSGIFNGRVVVVKSTDRGGADAFTSQAGLYTHLVRGIENGAVVQETWVNNSIKEVLAANTAWNSILEYAKSPECNIIVSNTTEVGIQYVAEPVLEGVPSSFPAKLLACLVARYNALGALNSSVVVVPTELIVGNGDKLKDIIWQHVANTNLPAGFQDWLSTEVTFCNSLVDRIVPGAPAPEVSAQVQQDLGYQDELLIFSEPYRLWAIQGGAKVKETLGFAQADAGVVIEEDITPYRERKLRLLNGVHTISVTLAYLAGFRTVKEMMDDGGLGKYVEQVALTEVVPSVRVDTESATAFAHAVLDRFRNPHIVHPLINITLQQSSKMNMRNAQTILNYAADNGTAPKLMALGLAATIQFSLPAELKEGKYYGEWQGQTYPLQDDKAAAWHALKEQKITTEALVKKVLSGDQFFDHDLSQVPGLASAVSDYISALETQPVKEVVSAALA